jgi:hypothetical protein
VHEGLRKNTVVVQPSSPQSNPASGEAHVSPQSKTEILPIPIGTASASAITKAKNIATKLPGRADQDGAVSRAEKPILDLSEDTQQTMIDEIAKLVATPKRRSFTDLVKESISVTNSKHPRRAKTYHSNRARDTEAQRPIHNTLLNSLVFSRKGNNVISPKNAADPLGSSDNNLADSSNTDSDSRLTFRYSQPLPIFNRRPLIINPNSKASALSANTVLVVPPQRHPLRSEGSDAAIVQSKKALAKVKSELSETGQQLDSSNGQNAEMPPDNQRPPGTLLVVNPNSSESAKKPTDSMRGLVPFFEWRTRPTSFQTNISARPAARVSSTSVTSDPQKMDDNLHPISRSATGILQHIDGHICESRHFDATRFPLKAEEWDKLEEKSLPDVQNLLNERKKVLSLQRGGELQEPGEFLDSKYRLCSTVRKLLQCFIYDVKHDEKVVRKLWGIVYGICSLTLKEVKCYRSSRIGLDC